MSDVGRALQIGEMVIVLRTGRIGMFVGISGKYNKVKFGADGPITRCGNIRAATEEEIEAAGLSGVGRYIHNEI